MYKKYKIADPQQAGPSHSRGVQPITDWKICCLCQTVTPESMQCPSEGKRTDVNVGQGYSTVATNLIRFNELQAMPMPIEIRRLDEGKGIEATMLEHLAKWHKFCKAKFTKSKLKRAKKKHSVKDCDPSLGASKKYTRQSATHKASTKYVCFFLWR